MPNICSDTVLLQIAVKAQAGFAQVVAPHFNVAPAHMPTQACAKGLEKGFLGSETYRIASIGGALCAAIVLLNVGVQTLDQACSPARDGALYTLDLDQVNADAVDHRPPLDVCGPQERSTKRLSACTRPSSALLPVTTSAAACTSATAFPMAMPKPAERIMSRSLWSSPMAIISSGVMPSWTAMDCNPCHFDTPACNTSMI